MSESPGPSRDPEAIERARKRRTDLSPRQVANPHVHVSFDRPLQALAPSQQHRAMERLEEVASEEDLGSDWRSAVDVGESLEANVDRLRGSGAGDAGRDGTMVRDWRSLAFFLLGVIPFAVLVTLFDDETLLAMGAFGVVLAAYVGWSYYVVEMNDAWNWLFDAPQALVAVVGTGIFVVWMGWIPASAVTFTHLGALTLFFVYYWFIALLAVYHRQRHRIPGVPDEALPDVTVLVPAYNEAGYIATTLRAVLEADYPRGKLEVVVVDDGSTDDTYEEAVAFESGSVKVVQKDNGGKYSALNYGLLFATGEVVVTIDADSIVHPDALREIVAPIRTDETIGSVASDVKVRNPGKLVTACQRLEYVVGMNVYRRMLDIFGAVTIVPGCLGAYRREVIEDVYAYDPDTLTEDFDVTVKVLKTGHKVAVSDAIVYTEVPDTWRDLYRQRIRWYRGNFMTVFKHWDLLGDHSAGFVHRLAFPLRVIELFVLPFASLVILAYIVLGLLAGQVVFIVALFVFFTSVIVLISLVALQIEGEDRTLAIYSPLFVIGYKHFHDLITIKSLLDVCFGREMSWTSATRIGKREDRS